MDQHGAADLGIPQQLGFAVLNSAQESAGALWCRIRNICEQDPAAGAIYGTVEAAGAYWREQQHSGEDQVNQTATPSTYQETAHVRLRAAAIVKPPRQAVKRALVAVWDCHRLVQRPFGPRG